MATLTHARTLYQRAQESGDFGKLGEYLAVLLQPAKPRATKRGGRRKEVLVAPIMQTVFADGRVCRMTVCQLEGDQLPVDKATSIARGIYFDHVDAAVPDVVSCERVNGKPRPANCGLVRHPLSIRSRESLGMISAETAEHLRRKAA